jgi:hypothetical protein
LLALLAAPGLVAQEQPDEPKVEPPPDQPIERAEEITVTAGLSDRRIQDVPLRIEVMVSEDNLENPGNGRSTVDAWAPLDGFVAKGGARMVS